MALSKPASRYVAEGAAIVLSILLAFGIDAWWEAQTERQEESRILTALNDELLSNRDTLAARVAWHIDVQSATLALMAEGTLAESTLPSDSLDQLIGGASWWGTSTPFQMATMDALTLSGKLALIRDEELLRGITAWGRGVARLHLVAAQDYDHHVAVFMPFLSQHAYMPQI